MTLSNYLETPTFYQTLSGVTHLDEQEIIDLEKKYWQLKSLSSNGKFDMQLFVSFTSAPFTVSSDEEERDILSSAEGQDQTFTVARGLFSAFDENCDGHLDFKEMVCGISAACRGPLVERIKCKLCLLRADSIFCDIKQVLTVQFFCFGSLFQNLRLRPRWCARQRRSVSFRR